MGGRRLDQERQAELEPQRIESTRKKLESMGFSVITKGKMLMFEHLGSTIRFWPYSGWFTGTTVNDGRGFKNLLKELNTNG